MKNSEEIKEVISAGLCGFILHPQYYFLFTIFTYSVPFIGWLELWLGSFQGRHFVGVQLL